MNRSNKGMTLVEATIMCSLFGLISIWAIRFSHAPVMLGAQIRHADLEQKAWLAVDVIAKDFREMQSQNVSESFDLFPKSDTGYLKKIVYEGTVREFIYVRYNFNSVEKTLERYEDRASPPNDESYVPSVARSSKTVVLTDIAWSPAPFFQKDTATDSRIMIVSFSYAPIGLALPGRPQTSALNVLKRISVRG